VEQLSTEKETNAPDLHETNVGLAKFGGPELHHPLSRMRIRPPRPIDAAPDPHDMPLHLPLFFALILFLLLLFCFCFLVVIPQRSGGICFSPA
jgi:hypothetical protein